MMDARQLREAILQGKYDDTFAALYERDATVMRAQRQRYADAISQFEVCFGAGRLVSLYSVPGRTEIGGNHTDHNHGIVMAAAVNLDIIAVVAQNRDNIARVQSKGFPMDLVDLNVLQPAHAEHGSSVGLIRGVAAGIMFMGGTVGGFDAYTTSDVFSGSGLSSSAAFEVCIASILNGEYNGGRFSPVDLAKICQRAENQFFGKPSGLMDQTACAVGSAITIDFTDVQNPVVKRIPMSLADFGYSLVITDTKGSHADLTSEYAAIRKEMEAVAGYFGKHVLREVDPVQFFACIPALREKVGDRAVLRAIHFYEECKRVPLLVQAMEARDFSRFLALIVESGHSSFEYNQNAYVGTEPTRQGISLGLALSQLQLAGSGAWRLQGGGFAGTIQAFVPSYLLTSYCGALELVFGAGACHVLAIREAGCIRVETGRL